MAQEIPVGGRVEVDAGELSEWSDSVDDLVRVHSRRDAAQVMATALARARALGLVVPGALHTDYMNTIPPEAEPSFPGDQAIEARIRHYVRWNAAVMVARANRRADGLGGHLSTYASAATLYEVGFNHFFRGSESRAGDQVFFQGHASPGIYARAYLEGRLSEGDLDGFRREVGGGLPWERRVLRALVQSLLELGDLADQALDLTGLLRVLRAQRLVLFSAWRYCSRSAFDTPEIRARSRRLRESRGQGPISGRSLPRR